MRWLGGMFTNYKTIRSSITRLENLLRQKEDGTFNKLTKKEGLKIQRDIDRLEKSIGGVTEMGGLPDALFIIDVKRESIAVSEASKMGIPIVVSSTQIVILKALIMLYQAMMILLGQLPFLLKQLQMLV